MLIPRIDLAPDENQYAFDWIRRQYPIRVAFCMTINKSQGAQNRMRRGRGRSRPRVGYPPTPRICATPQHAPETSGDDNWAAATSTIQCSREICVHHSDSG